MEVLEDRGFRVTADGYWLKLIADSFQLSAFSSSFRLFLDLARALERRLNVGADVGLAHVPMEPVHYLADVRTDRADLWGSTQVPENFVGRVAAVTGLKPAQIDGTEDQEIKITFPSGATREFTGQSLLLNTSLPNFYFHCTTAYDILRPCGIELGKRDFMGTPAQL